MRSEEHPEKAAGWTSGEPAESPRCLFEHSEHTRPKHTHLRAVLRAAKIQVDGVGAAPLRSQARAQKGGGLIARKLDDERVVLGWHLATLVQAEAGPAVGGTRCKLISHEHFGVDQTGTVAAAEQAVGDIALRDHGSHGPNWRGY